MVVLEPLHPAGGGGAAFHLHQSAAREQLGQSCRGWTGAKQAKRDETHNDSHLIPVQSLQILDKPLRVLRRHNLRDVPTAAQYEREKVSERSNETASETKVA